MKKSDESATRVEPGELEFPDWSGMDDSSARVDPDAAFLLCEEYPVWFAEAAARGASSVPKNAWGIRALTWSCRWRPISISGRPGLIHGDVPPDRGEN